MPHIGTKELVRELRRQDWAVEQTSQGHWRATPPDPQYPLVHMGNDSNDPHSMRNNLALLKKSGFTPPWGDPPPGDGTDMSNGFEGAAREKLGLDYLDQLLDLYCEVKKLPADQIVFTRETRGKWLMTVADNHVMADGDHGKGASPSDALRQIHGSLKDSIRARIRELQELEAKIR